MKIAIIGSAGIPAKYGGFETLTENLVKELNNDYTFTVYCSGPNYAKDDRKKNYLGAKLKYLPLSANGKSSIIYDFLSIFHAFFYADLLLILGVSGAFMIPLIKFLTNKKVITNIDGLEWKRDKWSKLAKSYLKKQEKIAVLYSDTTVVDNAGILNHVLHAYNKPSTLIAYGGDHVSHRDLKEKTKLEYNLPSHYAFKVCRIEPENNIHLILEAFCYSEMNLVLIGNWKNSKYGITLKNRFEKYTNLYLFDPIYDQDKLNEVRSNCMLYIHGHSAGGTNPSLVEAMCLELPILAFDVEYNRYTTNGQAYYFKNVHDLKELLNIIIKDNSNLRKVASNMKKIANKKYTWSIISKAYKALFN